MAKTTGMVDKLLLQMKNDKKAVPTEADRERAANAALGAGGMLESETIYHLPVSRLRPNPDQIRQPDNPGYSDDSLERLGRSLLERQTSPVVVRPIKGTENFEIIAGERRWRAANKVGKTSLDAIVRDIDDAEAQLIQVIDNIQREGNTPFEVAAALRATKELASKAGRSLTADDLATQYGMHRSTVSTLLNLPSPRDIPEVYRHVIDNGISNVRIVRTLIDLHNADPDQAQDFMESNTGIPQKDLREKATEALRNKKPATKKKTSGPSRTKRGRPRVVVAAAAEVRDGKLYVTFDSSKDSTTFLLTQIEASDIGNVIADFVDTKSE